MVEERAEHRAGELFLQNTPRTDLLTRQSARVIEATPQAWDIVISCFEPLTRVTGGIGTYTRLLVHRLAALYDSILVFTAADVDIDLPANVTLVRISTTHYMDKRALNNLIDDHFAYSYHLAAELKRLQDLGHRFRRAEFPDYGNDGYFALAMRKAGLLDLGHVSVRLHSPVLMLRDDNSLPEFLAPLDLLTHCAPERFALREADTILYGEQPMLDRVLSYMPEADLSELRAKSVRAPHPWPAPAPGLAKGRSAGSPATNTSQIIVNIGLVGRLEVRKGSYEMMNLWRDPRAFAPLPGIKVHYHLIGGSTPDWQGRSVEEVLRTFVAENDLSDAVHFHGKVSQNVLPSYFERLDGLLYPSRFENYPNALIEAMQQGKAVMVSVHGCMPTMTEEYPNRIVIDPNVPAALVAGLIEFAQVMAREQLRRHEHEASRRRAFRDMARRANAAHDLVYAAPPKAVVSVAADEAMPIAFVIPHYRQIDFIGGLLDDIAACLQAGDEVIVVDDASGPEVAERLQAVVAARGAPFRVLLKQTNEGPGAARDDGVAATRAAAVQFCDADDRLRPEGISAARRALARNAELDAIFGVQECFGDMDHYWVPTLPDPEISFVRNFAHSAGLFRRNVFARTEGYPRRRLAHFEDWLFDLRFMLAGGKALVLPQVTLLYRVKVAATRSSSNKDREYHSYRAILDDALDFSTRHARPVARAGLLRMLGQAYLLERGAASPGERTGLRPRRYDVADRIVGFLSGRPHLRKYVIKLAENLLGRRSRSS